MKLQYWQGIFQMRSERTNNSILRAFLSRLKNALAAKQPRATQATCRYCDAPLPNPRALQCLKCHFDWHDPNNVFQAVVDPNWNRFGVDPEKDYVIELCQEPSGRRYTKYREYPNGAPDQCCVLETVPAKGKAFVEWGYYGYAKHLLLVDGQHFEFEAHGIWLTSAEGEFLSRTRSADDRPAPWVNGIAPLLPPC